MPTPGPSESQPIPGDGIHEPLEGEAEARVQDAIGTIRAHAKLTDAKALKGPVRVISMPTLRLIVQALIKEAETDEGTARMIQDAAEARLERDQAVGRSESLQRKLDDVTRERDELQGIIDSLQEEATGTSVRLANVDRERRNLAESMDSKDEQLRSLTAERDGLADEVLALKADHDALLKEIEAARGLLIDAGNSRKELEGRLQAQELELTAVNDDREQLSRRVATLEERLGLASSELDVVRQEADMVVGAAETSESRRLRSEADAARLSRRRETLMIERGMLAKSTEELVSIVLELRKQLQHEGDAVEALERQIAGYREREEARSKRSGTRILGIEGRNKALVEAMEALESELAAERRRREEDVNRLEDEIDRLRDESISARFPGAGKRA
jgi:chromosome segregation ATPase